MPSFKYDPDLKKVVKTSDRVRLRGEDGRPFAQKILDGYRRQEGRALSALKPSTVKRLWAT